MCLGWSVKSRAVAGLFHQLAQRRIQGPWGHCSRWKFYWNRYISFHVFDFMWKYCFWGFPSPLHHNMACCFPMTCQGLCQEANNLSSPTWERFCKNKGIIKCYLYTICTNNLFVLLFFIVVFLFQLWLQFLNKDQCLFISIKFILSFIMYINVNDLFKIIKGFMISGSGKSPGQSIVWINFL